MRNHARLKNLLLLCLLIAGLTLVMAALPALAHDSAAEATAEETVEPPATWTPAPDEATSEVTEEPPATWTPAPTETTAEATTEATVEATSEATAEATVEATSEATAEIVQPIAPTPTPEPEPPPEPVTGLSTLMLLGGLGAVLIVGAVAVMRQRGGSNDDKV